VDGRSPLNGKAFGGSRRAKERKMVSAHLQSAQPCLTKVLALNPARHVMGVCSLCAGGTAW
jgi:hypothetical protein